MAKIIFLGTSASIPSKTRDNTAFVFQCKKESFLIDCPGSPAHKLLKAGIDFKKIKKIIITHHHPDHIYGIVSFIHSQGFTSKAPLTIFTNAHCITIIKKLINLFGLNRDHFPRVHFINVLRKKTFYKTDPLSLQAIANKHSRGSFGIKISFGKKVLFYSSDTAFLPAMLKKTESANYLIHDCTASSYYFKKYPALEAMHTSSKYLALWLKQHRKQRLIPIHFLTVDKNEPQRIKQELKAVKRQVIWARDFSKLNL